MDVNAEQVKNIPDNIETLVMSAGVGIQFACVLRGLRKCKKDINRIIAVQIGPDRRKRIDSYFEAILKDLYLNVRNLINMNYNHIRVHMEKD